MVQELLLRALFSHVKRPNREAVLQQLPEDLQERCKDALGAGDMVSLEDVIPDPMRLLKMVHKSWYDEIFGYSPKALQKTIERLFANGFGSLEKDRAPIAEFLCHYVIQRWPDCHKPSIEALQDHPLFWILQEDSQSLETIASLLAMHEIVDSVRKIVDKETLHRVLEPLSPVQQRYLRALLQRKSEGLPEVLSCQDLLKVNTSEAERRLLECGYSQMGVLLSGQDDLFFWHLFHRLDKNFAINLQNRLQEARSGRDKCVLEGRLRRVNQFLHRGERS